MPVNTYEGMFVLDTSKTALNWDESVQQVHGILAKHHAEIVASRPWDERRLAYPIKGHKKGAYLLTFFRADGSAIKGIEDDCRLSDLILRDLIQKIEPKLVEQLVSQAMSSTPSVEAEEARARDEDGDDRPRRRRRPEE